MINPTPNPYVGPRAFEGKDSDYFFGRTEETRQIALLVIAHRAVVFYAPSGVGKTSLLQASLIPYLQERTKVTVLPICRVGGNLPPGIDGSKVKDLYAFNTLLNLLGRDARPGDLVGLSLSEGLQKYFAAQAQPDGRRRRPRLLILDQFEELFSTYPDRYPERTNFFLQVQRCLADFPRLSVLFVMREDYIAHLDSYSVQLPDRLRARFRMERLGFEAALSAVKEPAARANRPFAEGVAEALVDNLRRIQVAHPRQGAAITASPLGTYVEPVHLQIVCRQLWASLPPDGDYILPEDVQEFGDVDQALTGFYEDVLKKVVVETRLSERRLRTWFDTSLITPARTRGLVYRGEEETEGLPNTAVDILNDAYIIRANVRGSDAWYELAHDRLVEPILAANKAWHDRHQNPLTLAAEAWLASDKDPQKLYKGDPLQEAQAQAEANPDELTELEHEFIGASREAARRQAAKRQQVLLLGAVGLIVLFASLAGLALFNARQAKLERDTAATAEADAIQQRSTAQAASTAAIMQRSTAQAASTAAIMQQAAALAAKATAEAERNSAVKARAILAANLEAILASVESTPEAVVALLTPSPTGTAFIPTTGGPPPTSAAPPTPTPNLAATATVEALRAQLAEVRATQTAVALDASMVFVPAGSFKMGSLEDSLGLPGLDRDPEPEPDEFPQRTVSLPDFWIDRTEVTNASYRACVEVGVCPPQSGGDPVYHNSPEFDNYPVVFVSWDGANTYCQWVGKRLPTEAEWEKAARGTDGRIWPWGNGLKDDLAGPVERASVGDGVAQGITEVGSYPNGASPYGALDMTGNVWEWASDWYSPTYYAERPDPDSSPPGPSEGASTGRKVIRGGSFLTGGIDARTAERNGVPSGPSFDIGFRCARSG